MSKDIHVDKYIYSKTIFTRKKDKVKIICPKHGEFEQIADNHLRGNGCMECYGKKKLTNDEFIKKSNYIHNNKYDYTLVEYKNNKDKVKIICPKHGIFVQIASNHLYGYGCPGCANNKKSTNNDFEIKSNLIHKDKYLYNKVNYINNKTRVIIFCPIHGDFEISPSNHLKGIGCSKCSGKYKPSTSEFIEKCKKIHSNRYNYSMVDYKNNRNYIKIICPKHGEFKQRPSHHLNGIGCPGCNKSSGELLIEKYLNINNIKFKSEYKFKDLKLSKTLRFDFAIFDEFDNIKYLLEYNGIQHYFFNERFHRHQGDYEYQLLRDNLKTDYCINNNIKLYIIRYDEDIEKSIIKIIKENEKEDRI